MSRNQVGSKSAAIFHDFASVLALMRTTTKQQCSLSNPRALDFYEALEVAWAAAMLLGMEADEARQTNKADAA